MAKKMKKVNPKDTQKASVMTIVTEALEAAGLSTSSGEDFGFTKGTIVVHGETCDVQIKPITPKAGIDRYEAVEDEEG